MTPTPPHIRVQLRPLLVACGVLAWLGVVAPVLVQDSMRRLATPVWWAAVGLHQVAFLVQQWANANPARARLARFACAAMVPISLVGVVVYSADGLSPLLFVITMATMGFFFSRTWVIATLVFFAVVLTVVLPRQDLGIDWIISYFALLCFAALMVEVAVSETQARAIASATTAELEAMNGQLARSNTELAAAHNRLARQQVNEERLRISRDLHDTIGHQLTALSLHLEVASHLTEGRAAAHLEQSRELAKEIITSLRTVVSTMREPGLQLTAELDRLREHLAASGFELETRVGHGMDRLPPGVAEVLVRIAQEALTNVTKHAQASHVVLEVCEDDGWVRASVRDDGRGAQQVVLGNGISGMRERVHALGGTVAWTTQPGHGFDLMVRLPMGVKEGM